MLMLKSDLWPSPTIFYRDMKYLEPITDLFFLTKMRFKFQSNLRHKLISNVYFNLKDTLQRKVIEQGMFIKHCIVEIYLMTLKLQDSRKQQEIHHINMSRVDTIGWYMYLYPVLLCLLSVCRYIFNTHLFLHSIQWVYIA